MSTKASPAVITRVILGESLTERLRDFWHEQRFGSQAEALRWLLDWALNQAPKR